MPYSLVRSGKGYKVSSPHGTMSKKPMPKGRAERQMRALNMALSSKRKRGKYER